MPVRAFVTRGATADCARTIAPIDRFAAERLLADKGHNRDEILARAEKQGMEAVIPGHCPDRMHLFMGFSLVTTLSRRNLLAFFSEGFHQRFHLIAQCMQFISQRVNAFFIFFSHENISCPGSALSFNVGDRAFLICPPLWASYYRRDDKLTEIASRPASERREQPAAKEL